MKNSTLLNIPHPNPNADVRLICFSYAGGTSDIFQPWVKQLNSSIELILCQLPGRTSRLTDSPYVDMATLIQDLLFALHTLADKPLILFGHSMGAKVAFELQIALRSYAPNLFVHLIASACSAPHLPRRKPAIHKLPDALFVLAVAKLNGVPLSVLNNAELIKLIIPALRADFCLIETYRYNAQADQIPAMTLIGGKQDTVINTDDLIAWQEISKQTIDIHWLNGDHFFIKSHSTAVLKLVHQVIKTQLKSLYTAAL